MADKSGHGQHGLGPITAEVLSIDTRRGLRWRVLADSSSATCSSCLSLLYRAWFASGGRSRLEGLEGRVPRATRATDFRAELAREAVST